MEQHGEAWRGAAKCAWFGFGGTTSLELTAISGTEQGKAGVDEGSRIFIFQAWLHTYEYALLISILNYLPCAFTFWMFRAGEPLWHFPQPTNKSTSLYIVGFIAELGL
jgi:hypothetical protein